MKTYIIPQKQSNSGSIHDIASDLYDREIKFPEGSKYAVVLSDYYGGVGYTTHRSELMTIFRSKELGDQYSHQIIDSNGNQYAVNVDRLCCL